MWNLIAFVGFAVNHAGNFGIGIQNVKMNGWKRTDECMDKVLELVRKQNTWKHNINCNNTIYSNSTYDMECRYDARDGNYIKSTPNNRLVFVWC